MYAIEYMIVPTEIFSSYLLLEQLNESLIKYLQWLIVQINFQLVFNNFSILSPEIVKAFKINWKLCLCINLMLVGFLFVDLFEIFFFVKYCTVF